MSDSVGVAFAEFIFGLIRFAIGMAIWIMIFPTIARWFSKHFMGGWNQPEGQLNPFSVRRLMCKHQVAYWGAGTHGLWAHWCADCGRKLERR